MDDAALVLRDVTFAYPTRPAILRRVDLAVPKAKITVILGANGSGKTTLLRLAAGLARPQQGEALVAGGTPAHVAARKGRLGYIPQQLGLVRSATVRENVLHGGLRESGLASILGAHAAAVRERADAALDLVGLREKETQSAKTLSGGERQRVAIARTLVQRPEVVVADELISSLDAVHAQAIMEICRVLRTQGVAMLLALHHIDVALSNADEVRFLAHGALSAPRRPDELTPEEARSALVA